VKVLEPKPNAVIPYGQPIKLKIKSQAPQGPEILELFCELIDTFALPAQQKPQEIVLGIINKQITAGTFTYRVVFDKTTPNTMNLGYGPFIL
ncbi:8595_t:CDS:2, partial [Paraglomus occultum]